LEIFARKRSSQLKTLSDFFKTKTLKSGSVSEKRRGSRSSKATNQSMEIDEEEQMPAEEDMPAFTVNEDI